MISVVASAVARVRPETERMTRTVARNVRVALRRKNLMMIGRIGVNQ